MPQANLKPEPVYTQCRLAWTTVTKGNPACENATSHGEWRPISDQTYVKHFADDLNRDKNNKGRVNHFVQFE